MSIAITADVHINEKYPERARALEALVTKAKERGAEEVVAAGDLFDGPVRDPAFIDYLADSYLPLVLVPGNHDPGLRQGFFSSKRITVVEKPLLREGKTSLLFLPYREGATMGGVIEASGYRDRLGNRPWVLISHGDFGRYGPEDKGEERGYFPLTRRDFQRFNPSMAILGHIHRGHQPAPGVYYPGSPWPLDITERGRRRFLILDTGTLTIESHDVPGAPLNGLIDLVVVPGSDEAERVRRDMAAKIKKITGKGKATQVTLRVYLRGNAEDRGAVEEAVKGTCASEGVILEDLQAGDLLPATDLRLGEIARRVRERIDKMDLAYRPDELVADDVLARAMELLYGQVKG